MATTTEGVDYQLETLGFVIGQARSESDFAQGMRDNLDDPHEVPTAPYAALVLVDKLGEEEIFAISWMAEEAAKIPGGADALDWLFADELITVDDTGGQLTTAGLALAHLLRFYHLQPAS